MARTRSYYPPLNCDKCFKPPLVGQSLWHSGVMWLCPACLADATHGTDLSTKATSKFLNHDSNLVRSRQKRAAGDIEKAEELDNKAGWHCHAGNNLVSHGKQKIKGALAGCGEATTAIGEMRDTLANPDLVSIEASESRGRYLVANDIVALGLDLADTINASNSVEKLLAYDIALAHKIANEQAHKASYESDPAIEIKRLRESARMLSCAQQGILTLHKLRTGGTQNVIVQHVHVSEGGQAVIGAVQTTRETTEK